MAQYRLTCMDQLTTALTNHLDDCIVDIDMFRQAFELSSDPEIVVEEYESHKLLRLLPTEASVN